LHLHLRGAIPLSYIRNQIDNYSPHGIKNQIPFWQKAIFLLLKTTRPLMLEKQWTDALIQNLFNTKTFTKFLISFYFTLKKPPQAGLFGLTGLSMRNNL
jgi:hypothetical protein